MQVDTAHHSAGLATFVEVIMVDSASVPALADLVGQDSTDHDAGILADRTESSHSTVMLWLSLSSALRTHNWMQQTTGI